MSKNKKILCIALIVLIVLNLAFIWGNSLLDKQHSSNVSSSFTEVIKPILKPILKPVTDSKNMIFGYTFEGFVRKMAHFSEFALLGILLTILRKNAAKPSFFTVMFITLAVAVTDESIQIFSSRGDSVKDILIDYSGALTGIFITILLCILIRLIKKSKKQGG